MDLAGIEVVCNFEVASGRDVKVMPQNNPGYDVESMGAGYEVRYIEVKSLSGDWDQAGVGLSHTQYSANLEFGREFWLYVVERAHGPDPRLFRIHDPASKATTYFFDQGWKDFADHTGSP